MIMYAFHTSHAQIVVPGITHVDSLSYHIRAILVLIVQNI